MHSSEWGTWDWNEDHFPSNQLDNDGDTWGIRWRGMEKMRHNSYLRLVENTLRASKPLDVLDIGSALCDFTEKAWRMAPNNNISCVDISDNAIAWSTKKFPQFRVKKGSILDLPFDEEFDVIFCLEVLCYVNADRRVTAIESILEHLPEGGTLVFSGVLDQGRQHHTEKEVTDLIGSKFRIDRLHFNYWHLYRQIVERPLERVREAGQSMRELVGLSAENYSQWRAERNGGAKVRVADFLRKGESASIFAADTISRLAKWIIRMSWIARVFHWISRLTRGRQRADEIVVIARKI